MEKEDIAATEGGGGEDVYERRRRAPNGRCPRLRQRGRSSPVSQSALAPSPRALAPQGLAPRALCVGPGGSSPRVGGGRGLRGAADGCGLGPARTMQGEGCRKGVCAGRGGDLGFRASFLPPHRSLAALRAAGGPPGCLVSPRLGLETELSVRPALGFGKRGEAGWVQRRVRAGSGRRGRSGFLKTSVGIVQGPSVSRKSLR